MVSLEYAISKVLEHSKPLSHTEQVTLWESLGRALASDITSDINMPPFNKSAVDGYACRKDDLQSTLKVLEVIPAGQMPTKIVTAGTCSKIMTGAPLPDGADCVIMVEEVEDVNASEIHFTGKYSKPNIARFAEDTEVGDIVLSKGILIEPKHIAILAAVGASMVTVATKPRVSILITGDELVEPEIKPELSQIRNSNGHQLYAQVINAGAIPVYGGIVDDTKESTQTAIAQALEKSNIVVLTGGVSMGDFDYVPNVLKDLGVDIMFQTIAVQPGKPTLFGVKGDKLVFGLPGNPVSSLFQFDLLVQPAIKSMMGLSKPTKDILKMPLANDYKRKRAERLALVPARINNSGEVEPINYHGSAHIFALAKANAMVIVPLGVDFIKKGETVDVRQL
ncbi:MAG: molybdopterin molybdenumtransferase MoeA [Bacteroidetes bacterium HGW-Bacteroidetes-15]|nr:MAG: molybdopterin molybdenumtransferase MoeA [Bacteroidetes bacterium HGW-Bacteroidetes-15]